MQLGLIFLLCYLAFSSESFALVLSVVYCSLDFVLLHIPFVASSGLATGWSLTLFTFGKIGVEVLFMRLVQCSILMGILILLIMMVLQSGKAFEAGEHHAA
ncbi:hypothetical protein KPC83_03360 [Collinsella sp. zg1085]|uniref:hypothetical protein n=1 Tax=Collinsella sp. zg1085 TaxID=2844380 RepID=UPI001C0E5AC6|nr:hypothetical protein [Collinsella sp. zg1085]QWT18181.1 hypothetical protein KPC83_03360 [Collinsella sp. zg1085]